MKTYSLKPTVQEQENTSTVWEAFVECLESVYFEGAVEILEPELVNLNTMLIKVATDINRSNKKYIFFEILVALYI